MQVPNAINYVRQNQGGSFPGRTRGHVAAHAAPRLHPDWRPGGANYPNPPRGEADARFDYSTIAWALGGAILGFLIVGAFSGGGSD